MVHEPVLLADLVEHVGRTARTAPRATRGVKGGSFRCGSGQPMQRHPLGEVEPVVGPRHDPVVFDLEVLARGCSSTRGGIEASTCSSDERAVAQLLERAVDRLQQIGLAVLVDLHVRVADDAEQVRADDLDAGKERRPGSCGSRPRGTRTSRPEMPGDGGAKGTGMKRGSPGGSLTRANLVRRSCRTTTAKFLLRFEISGKGCPGSKASGVSSG